MNLLAESTIQIQCPAATLFQFATNMENFGRWFPGVKAIASGNDLAHGEIGKLYHETVSIPVIGKIKIPLKVVLCEPQHKFVTEGDFPVLSPRMEISFEEIDSESCRMHWRMYSRTGFGISRLVANPVIRAAMQRRADKGLARLKKGLEEGFPARKSRNSNETSEKATA